jgi:carbon-monoxide dehydrogenase medium subunit
MIPAPFDYVRAKSLDEAIALLAEHGDDAKLLAGGQSLLPLMKIRLAAPAVLVDIARVDGGSYIRLDGEEVVIGALTRHADLADSTLLQQHAPLIAGAASHVGDRQIRHRGTIGGSLSHADPAADLPAAVLASGGAIIAQGPNGRREISVDDFFVGYFETALTPGELLTEIRVPRGRVNWHYEKFVRRANDWAIVGVATAGGRIAFANMGSTPLRAVAAEQAFAAGAPADEAAELAAEGTSPVADMHADQDYRRHLARVLTRRSLLAAAARSR